MLLSNSQVTLRTSRCDDMTSLSVFILHWELAGCHHSKDWNKNLLIFSNDQTFCMTESNDTHIISCPLKANLSNYAIILVNCTKACDTLMLYHDNRGMRIELGNCLPLPNTYSADVYI